MRTFISLPSLNASYRFLDKWKTLPPTYTHMVDRFPTNCIGTFPFLSIFAVRTNDEKKRKRGKLQEEVWINSRVIAGAVWWKIGLVWDQFIGQMFVEYIDEKRHMNFHSTYLCENKECGKGNKRQLCIIIHPCSSQN